MAALMRAAAARAKSRSRWSRLAGSGTAPAGALSMLAVLGVAVLLASGCAKEASLDFAHQEKLGYIRRNGSASEVILTTVAGGPGQSYLSWTGGGERFSFSNDGRFFYIGLWAETQALHSKSLVVATDGSAAWTIPGDSRKASFSPDSRKIAFCSLAQSGPGTSTVGVRDIASGATRILAHGNNLEDPTWVDNNTLIYTERDGGRVYRLDVGSGTSTALTPPDRHFTNYTFPVSRELKKITLTETGPHYNIWTLDPVSGSLQQVTNNTRYHYRAGYLPGSNKILFQEQLTKDNSDSSELGVTADDGDSFSMLTNNFFFDGLQTISLNSGLVAYQHKEDSGSSIVVESSDGAQTTTVASGGAGDLLGDPNFAPVPAWTAANPLKLSIDRGAPAPAGTPVSAHITNSGANAVEAIFRAFPGTGLKLQPGADPAPQESTAPGAVSAGEPGPGVTSLLWRIRLDPGQSRDIRLTGSADAAAAPGDSTLLLTLAVTGSPPRMFWADLG